MTTAVFVKQLALDLAVEALLDLLAEANDRLAVEHNGPWHETCPTCEVYERIDKVLTARALAQVTGEEGA